MQLLRKEAFLQNVATAVPFVCGQVDEGMCGNYRETALSYGETSKSQAYACEHTR